MIGASLTRPMGRVFHALHGRDELGRLGSLPYKVAGNETRPHNGAMENPTSSSTQNYLREFLQDRHVACPACKRDLCGVEAPRCPGCNVELVLGLSSVEGYRWPWGVLVTLLTLDAAIGVLFATMVVNMGKWPTRYGLTPIFVMFMSSIPLVPLALFSQRRFYRQAVAFQWIWLGAGVMFTVVAFGSLFVLLLARR